MPPFLLPPLLSLSPTVLPSYSGHGIRDQWCWECRRCRGRSARHTMVEKERGFMTFAPSVRRARVWVWLHTQPFFCLCFLYSFPLFLHTNHKPNETQNLNTNMEHKRVRLLSYHVPFPFLRLSGFSLNPNADSAMPNAWRAEMGWRKSSANVLCLCFPNCINASFAGIRDRQGRRERANKRSGTGCVRPA